MKPTIAITMGDPVGVGPEIVLRALASPRVRRVANPVVIGDWALLTYLAGRLRLRAPAKAKVAGLSGLDPRALRPGRPTAKASRAAIGYVEEAVAMALSGRADAVATAPLGKEAARKAGFPFPGHTEFIAHLTGAKDFAMMLGGKKLKVVLVTIHEPLRKVPSLVTGPRVYKTIRIADLALKRFFGVKSPRVAVAGLNPHAGEGGSFGEEDKKVIAPAIKRARKAGVRATGPIAPDTVFYRAVRKGEFDCVVCMYHDQGLGPLKLLHFEDGVNVTLGLPIIRTSPDHGTAYDIAWTGKASPESMIAAIETAVEMIKNRGEHNL